MIPDDHAIKKLHRRYAQNDVVFERVYTHCQIVTEIAEWCVERSNIAVDHAVLRAACMLHDIGTYVFFDDQSHDINKDLYRQHATFGAALLREEGIDQRIVDVVRSHILLGLSQQEIVDNDYAMPHADFTAQSIEARLLCYADRFHSKQPTFNDFESFLEGLRVRLPLQAQKFQDWSEEFGVPDISALATKYNHPIRK